MVCRLVCAVVRPEVPEVPVELEEIVEALFHPDCRLPWVPQELAAVPVQAVLEVLVVVPKAVMVDHCHPYLPGWLIVVVPHQEVATSHLDHHHHHLEVLVVTLMDNHLHVQFLRCHQDSVADIAVAHHGVT